MLEAIVFLALWAFWALLCHNLAKAKGRDTRIAIVAGFVFGVFAVLYYAVATKVEPTKPGT